MSVRTRTPVRPRTGSARQRRRRRIRLSVVTIGGVLLAGAVIAAVRFGASTDDGNGAELPPVTAMLVGPGAPAKAVFDTVLKAAVDGGHQLLVGPLTSADQASNDRMTKDGINDLERNADQREAEAGQGPVRRAGEEPAGWVRDERRSRAQPTSGRIPTQHGGRRDRR